MTAEAPIHRPFYELLGLRQGPAQDGRSEVSLPADPRLGNSRGDVHGGAIFGLLDAACATAARSTLPPGSGCTTVSLTANFIAPGRGGLVAHGSVLRTGGRIVAVEAEARDESGALVAKAQGTMAVLRPRTG
jgi:uncharacterized protein (TIGR00369 family)